MKDKILINEKIIEKFELDYYINSKNYGVSSALSALETTKKKKKSYFMKEEILKVFEESGLFFASLAYASEVKTQADKNGIADDAVSVVIPGAVCYMPFAELVDISKEIERLEKEEKRLQGELARVNGMLNNERFISKAPAAKIEEEKAKLEKYQQMMAQVQERLGQLK